MISPLRRRMLLLALGLLLASCTRPGGDTLVSPMPTVAASTAAAEARTSPPTATKIVAARSSTRSATTISEATATRTAAVISPGTPRGTTTGSAVMPPIGPSRPLTPPPTVGAEVWGRLRRPLQIPMIATGAACSLTEGRNVAPAYGPALGDGPVYAVGLGTAGVLRYSTRQEGGWYYQKVLFVVAPAYRGPVLIRGRQLDGPNEARFDEGAVPPAELQLAPAAGESTNWRNYPSFVRFHVPGCYAWQFDGEGFSTVVIFQVVQ